jgi:negative regulator of flagellin synthesis FlgM
MRVTDQNTTNTTQRPENAVRGKEVSRTKSSEDVDNSNEVAAGDRVELSSQARDIQRAREVAQEAPEVREDKVEAARRAVQSGSLNLKGQDLTEKLLQDALPSREP